MLQGIDAGGHGKAFASIVTLVPEVRDAFGNDFPLIAAGGIMDGRGLAAALTLGASGAVMGMLMTNHYFPRNTYNLKEHE